MLKKNIQKVDETNSFLVNENTRLIQALENCHKENEKLKNPNYEIEKSSM